MEHWRNGVLDNEQYVARFKFSNTPILHYPNTPFLFWVESFEHPQLDVEPGESRIRCSSALLYTHSSTVSF